MTPHGYMVGYEGKERKMKLIKILYKSGEQFQYIVKDEVAAELNESLREGKSWHTTWGIVHVGGMAWVDSKEIAQLNVVDKNIVINSRSTVTPSGRIRVRRLRNPLEQEKHYENPCN